MTAPTAWPFPITPEGRRAACSALVAGNATGPDDARQLWDALGLDAEDLAAGLADIRTRRATATAVAEPTEKETPSMDAYTAVARSMASDGHTTTRIAAELGLAEDEVARLVSGQQDHVGDDTATQEPTLIVPDAPAPDLALVAATQPQHPQAQDGAGRVLQVNRLLAWADQHEDPQVRADSAQARTLLQQLAQRRAGDARELELTAVVTELETRLAAARAELDTLRPAPAKKPGRRLDYDPKTVRAWAAENGYQVAPQGLVAKHVVDAWRAANPAPSLRIA